MHSSTKIMEDHRKVNGYRPEKDCRRGIRLLSE